MKSVLWHRHTVHGMSREDKALGSSLSQQLTVLLAFSVWFVGLLKYALYEGVPTSAMECAEVC